MREQIVVVPREIVIAEANRPEVGVSNPPRMLSSVDLPLPEGPSKTTNSPGNNPDQLRKAWISDSPVR